MNYVPFAEAIVAMVTELYRATAKHPSVIHGHVLQNIVKVRLLFHYANYISVTLRVTITQIFSCLHLFSPAVH